MTDQDNFDLDIEIEDEGDNEAAAFQKLAKLRQKIKVLTSEKTEYLAGWQRAKADYLNVERLRQEEKGNLKNLVTIDILSQFIPLLDHFSLALAHPKWSDNDSSFTKGVEFIYRDLERIINSFGVEKIEPLGKDFEPETSEAVELIDTEDETKDHKVLEVIKSGYRLGDKIIRPAQVKVGKLIAK